MGTDLIEASFRQALRSFRPAHNKDEIHHQQQSPLFKLPPEIREQVWELTLSPQKGANQPHFHVYNEVYDSCLYCTQCREGRYRRRHPTQMSLLLTCRLVYNEAMLFLWKNSKFTLVVCAGNPRPHNELHGRNCLGPIIKCKDLFARMRHVTLVIQPGKRPAAPCFADRAEELLKAMDYLQRAETLCLHLNFHSKLTKLHNGPLRFKTILKPFQTLDRHGRHFCMEISPNTNNNQAYHDLFHTIAGPQRRGNMITTHPLRGSTACVQRAQRDESPAPPPGDLGWAETTAMIVVSTVLMGGYVAVLPLSLGVTYAYHVRRKINKGDDHAWVPWMSLRRGN